MHPGAVTRSEIYGHLSMGFRFPSPDLTAELVAGSFQAGLAGLPFAAELAAVPPKETQEGTLSKQYAALFDVGVATGPPCSLYEGEYGGGRMGVMEDILRFYRFFGLRLSPAEWERPDHLATELEFLHWLATQEEQHLDQGDTEGAARLRRAAHDFLAAHTLHLVQQVAEHVGAHGTAPLYTGLSRVAAAFCTQELADSDNPLGDTGARNGSAHAPLRLRRLYEDTVPSDAILTYDLSTLRARPIVWDRVVKSSHQTNCWYQRSCNYNLYVCDGVVLREEQVGNYPPPNDPTAPDPNPRGCQKGTCYSHRTYDPARLKYPLKRVGKRGEGRWERLSWDQALTEISDGLLDVLLTDGPEVVIQGGGTRVHSLGTEGLGVNTFFEALGSPLPSQNVEIGDGHQGAAITAGKIMFADSADNWLYADIILVWGGNPAYTNIPNFHYLAEARYRGARVITIAPDYNASAVHADEWVPVNVGSDAALALGMAQVIIRDGLYRADFIREQTDMPLLVRTDTNRFLREKDLKRGGRDDVFYVYDEASSQPVEAPRKNLNLNGLKPALDGEFQVRTHEGTVRVQPVFTRLRRQLDAEYTPARAAEITGVPAVRIERLARDVAQAGGVVNVSSSNWGKFYHGDLIERAMFLLFALCGHMGRKGASFNAFPALTPDTAVGALERQGHQMLLSASSSDPRYAGWVEDGYTREMMLYEYAKQAVASGSVGLTGIVHSLHGGLLDLSADHQSWDPHLKRPLRDYVRESLNKGWQVAVPPPEKSPRILFQVGGNVLRRARASNQFREALLSKLKLLVTVDWRMSSTALYSDYVLPASGWYERDSVTMMGSTQSPYAQMLAKAIDPLYESLSEWPMFVQLARKLSERAQSRGVTSYRDAKGTERRLDRLEQTVTMGGLYPEDDEEGLARDAFTNAGNLEPLEWQEFKERGIAAYTGIGTAIRSIGNACELTPGEPMVPLTWHTEGKQPYPTLTRRLQFYIDHNWYLELGEALPVHKDPPRAGGDYPLQVTGGHARWSIHSDWIDNRVLLDLQRLEPVMFVNAANAAERGLHDGDKAEVFNDVGRFRIQVVVSPAVRPGQVVVYHGWENYQFDEWQHFKSVMPSPLNPIEWVGDYGHIRPDPVAFSPGPSDRGSRVEVRAV